MGLSTDSTIGLINRVHRLLSETGEGISTQRIDELLTMAGVGPTGLMRGNELFRSFGYKRSRGKG